jgi:myosin-3
LAAILIIGNIHVEEDENSYFHVEGVSIITNGELIDNVSELLKIKPSHLERVIISSTVMTHGETIITPNTVEQAMDSRDAIAKSLYGRLFSWIVNKINPSLNPTKERYNHGWII